MLMCCCVSDAGLPALSVQVPVVDCSLPSVVTVCETEPLTGPDAPSAQVHDRLTFVLFQPFAFAAVRLASVTVGFVASYLNDRVFDAVLPALSVQLPCTPAVALSGPA